MLGINNEIYKSELCNQNTFEGNDEEELQNQKQALFENPYINLKAKVNQSVTSLNNNTSPSKSTGKRLNQFQKRDLEFQKLYEEKLIDLRKNNKNLIQIQDQVQNVKKQNFQEQNALDIALYRERNEQYKIISNNIMARSQMNQNRKYVHKSVKILEKFFDPLRIKLRIMPLSRAPLVQGKNSDYYFVEAAKTSLKGNLPLAIQLLKKGLELKPTHFLCRFNHGVVQFKLGLIQNSLDDFEMLTNLYQKEAAAFYNLAICYTQTGRYQEAIDQCNKTVQINPNDKSLIYDAYKLKGICLYRIGQAQEAIKCFNLANRYRDQLENQQNQTKSLDGNQNLEFVYINLFIEETLHIFSDPQFQTALLSISRSEKKLRPLTIEMQRIKKSKSQKQFGLMKAKEFKINDDKTQQQQELKISLKQVNDQEIAEFSLPFSPVKEDQLKKQQQRPFNPLEQSDETSLDFNKIHREYANSLPKVLHKRETKISNAISSSRMQQQTKQTEDNYEKAYTLEKAKASSLYSSPKTRLDQRNKSLDMSPKVELKLRKTKERKEAIEKLKDLIGANSKEEESNNKQKALLNIENSFYEQLKEQVSKVVNAGTTIRFEKLFNIGNQNEANPSQLTREEQEQIQKRLKMEEELNNESDDQVEGVQQNEQALKKKQQQKMNNAEIYDSKFLQFLLNINEIKMKSVTGTEQEYGLLSIAEEQKRLEQLFNGIKKNFEIKQLEWEKDIEKGEKALLGDSIGDDNLSEGSNDHKLKNDKFKIETENAYFDKVQKKRQEKIIEKLKETLKQPDCIPDDVQNILISDLQERIRLEQQAKFRHLKASKRLTFRQLDIIRKELQAPYLPESVSLSPTTSYPASPSPQFNKQESKFTALGAGQSGGGGTFHSKRTTIHRESQINVIRKSSQNESQSHILYRNCKLLDKMLKSLKFFKRFEENVRLQIYNKSEHLSLPAQSIIFKQGDVGDKLYVIIKGRVAVQVNSAEFGNMPVVVATLNDGEQFGELSLIKLDEIKDHSKPGEVVNLKEKPQEQFAKRKATCITVEQTDLLAIPKEVSTILYQPHSVSKTNVKKKGKKHKKQSIQKEQDEKQDELNDKIAFLQGLSIFEEVDAKLLMPIAVNMIPVVYNFGEYIMKEGDIPKGLYIVKSGQCKVASVRMADRMQNDNEYLNQKLGIKKKIKDKDPIFNDYEPDGSLLNDTKSLKKAFQNDRVHVDEKGDQIRGRITYQDIMSFSQLMPKNFFGGRVLLPFEMYFNLRKIYFGVDSVSRYYPKGVNPSVIDKEPEDKYQLKSFLSVIADSGQVEVYILDKNDMGYLPDYILRKVFEKIALLKEPDRPLHEEQIEHIKEQMKNWEKFKVEQVHKMLRERFTEKNKGRIK